MLSDQSIKEKKDDLLQRYPFAEKIARIIASQSNKDPLVISINGPWGDGKSTVFEFLETELKQKEVPTLVFNPWRYPHEDDLLRAFFVELAETLDDDLLTKGEKLAKQAREKMWWFKDGVFGLLKEAGKLQTSPESPKSGGWFRVWITTLLSPFVSGLITNQMVGSLLSHVGAWLTPSIQELRERLKKKLMLNEKRIAVLLDDPDRLEAEELFALFRLIKLTADFNYTTFVLAMDYDAVAKTVGGRFNGEEEGRKFLEKIVQVPLRLPAVPKFTLTKFAIELIKEVLKDLDISLSTDEWKRFLREFDPVLIRRITTPRLAKRYANAMKFALGLTAGEVNEVDVMLMEALRLLEADTFHRLLSYLLEGEFPYWTNSIDSDVEESIENRLNWILPRKSDESDHSDLRGLLIRLFPFRFKKGQFTEQDEIRERQNRRLACDDCIIRYSACAVPEHDVPDSDVEEVLSLAQSTDSGPLAGRLEALYNEKTGLTLIAQLRRNRHGLNDMQRSSLVEALTLLSAHFSNANQSINHNQILDSCSALAADCISKHSKSDDRESLLKHLIEQAGSWLWCAKVFRSIRHQRTPPAKRHSSFDPEPALSSEQYQRIGKMLAYRIITEFELEFPTLPLLVQSLASSLCEEFGDRRRIHEWTKQALINDSSYLKSLVVPQLKWLHSDDGGNVYEWPGDDRVLDGIAKHVDLDWLRSAELTLPPVQANIHPPFISVEEAIERLFDLLNASPPFPVSENPPDAPTG